MRCVNCGAEVEGSFCPNCGTPVSGRQRVADDLAEKGTKKPVYKRVWFWLLIVLLALVVCLGSCVLILGSLPSTEAGEERDVPVTDEDAPEPTAVEAADEALPADDGGASDPSRVTVDEQVVFDREGIRITVKELDMRGSFMGPELKVLIENDQAKSISVQVRNVSVNGIMVEDVFSCDVASGKKANDAIAFLPGSLETAGIEAFGVIELSFHIFDTETWDTILDSDPVTIPTSLGASYVQAVDDSGPVAVDRDGIRIVMKQLDVENSFWGADLYVLIENDSQHNITVQTRDVSVNGFMVDPLFFCDVLSGKKTFTAISFEQSELDDNGITDITTLELVFHVSDMDSWDVMFDSETVTLTY